MKRSIASRPLLQALCAFLIAGAAFWAMPRIADAQLYVTQGPSGHGFVSKYDAITGELMDAKFIRDLDTPFGLTVKGNRLFVVDQVRFVGEYDATTGAAIASFVKGLGNPFASALLRDKLFVSNLGDGTGGMVLEYNVTTGGRPRLLISTLAVPLGLLVSGDKLFVADLGTSSVGEYDTTTGTAINPNFIAGVVAPSGLLLRGNELFVSDEVGRVGKYDAATGVPIDANFIAGLGSPNGIALLGDKLFVASYTSGTVGEYDASTGAAINPSFIMGLTEPVGLAVKSQK